MNIYTVWQRFLNLCTPESFFHGGMLGSRIEDLSNQLKKIGWSSKLVLYKKVFSFERRLRMVDQPRISIIVISWRRHPDTLRSFEILEQQRYERFELVFVDNGSPKGSFVDLQKYIDTYVRLKRNTGAYLARNVGAVFARAPILFFLEDDGLPASNIVSAHLKAHECYDGISVRGVYRPKTADNPTNSLANHYYLGDKPFPCPVNLEGNASYKAETFFLVGGWDDDNPFGHGGLELSRRLLCHDPDYCKQIYSPDPVILHDYASDNTRLEQKLCRQDRQMKCIKNRYPDFTKFLSKWDEFRLRTDLLKMRNGPEK